MKKLSYNISKNRIKDIAYESKQDRFNKLKNL